MTYIGQQPSTTFDSGIQDRFTGLTTNTVTLTHDISAETDILVVWNNIVQDSSTYSVGGTGNKTLTLGGTLVSADIVTVYYTNRVMQSVSPTAGSVTTTTINDGAVTNDKLAGSIANSKLANSSVSINGSTLALGGSLTGIGDDNAPSFMSYMSSTQSIGNNSTTTLAFNNDSGTTGGIKAYDTDNAFDTSNYRFTPQTAGYYFAFMYVGLQDLNSGNVYVINLMKNGTSDGNKFSQFQIKQNGTDNIYGNTQGITYLNGSSDYINATLYHNHGSNRTTADTYNTGFGSFRLAGVS